MLPHAGALQADQQPMLASSSHGSSSSTAAAAPVVAQRMQNTRCFGRQLEGAMLSCFWPQGCCRAGAQQAAHGGAAGESSAAGHWWASSSRGCCLQKLLQRHCQCFMAPWSRSANQQLEQQQWPHASSGSCSRAQRRAHALQATSAASRGSCWCQCSARRHIRRRTTVVTR